jgi:hypothetical protein
MTGSRRTNLTAAILLAFSCLLATAGEPVVETGKLSESLSGQPVFEIVGSKNLSGDIRIISRQSEKIEISFKKTALASSKTESARFLDLIDFKLDVGEDRAIFTILSPSHAPWEGSDHSVNIEVLVELPEKMRIQGKTDFIQVEIGGPFQGVDLRSSFSSIYIKRIYGPVEVITSYGDINLRTIRGEIKAETEIGSIGAEEIIINSGYAYLRAKHGPIVLRDIQGPVEASTEYSTINVSDIDATYGYVVLRTSYGSIEATDVTGELICETSYSPVIIKNSNINHGHSRIETSYAPITVEFTEISNSDLYISNEYNGIDLSLPETVSTKLIAAVGKGGRIYTKGLLMRPTALNLTRLEAIVGDGESRIEVQVNGIGSINISGR